MQVKIENAHELPVASKEGGRISVCVDGSSISINLMRQNCLPLARSRMKVASVGVSHQSPVTSQ